MFDSTKVDLEELLKRIHKCDLQLPDFQRSYVWGEPDVRSLIASILCGYPVGALLTLERGSGEAGQLFKPRALEGAPKIEQDPKELLLDGQQRLTSLYQVAYSKAPVNVNVKSNQRVKRYYYIDLNKLINDKTDIEEAIVAVPEDKVLRYDFGRQVLMDLSTPEGEFYHWMFPLEEIMRSNDWLYPWRAYWKDQSDSITQIDDVKEAFYTTYCKIFERYEMPIIRLNKENSKEAICTVFEKVNVGGKKLDAFELVTAMFAGEGGEDGFDLRRDWYGDYQNDIKGRYNQMIEASGNQRNVLKNTSSTDFLQAITLLKTRKKHINSQQADRPGQKLPPISCKRGDMLQLQLDDYKAFADDVERGFVDAAKFLNEEGILWYKDVPYPPLMMGLAAVFAILNNKAESLSSKSKIAQWFWCVTLGELYSSTTDTQIARDVPAVVRWIEGENILPSSVENAFFHIGRLDSLRTRNAAAYKGIHALLMREGSKDFITGRKANINSFYDDQIDIHHIFPQAWCKKQGIPPQYYDAIINKTALAGRTNRIIGGKAPSEYLNKIEKKWEIKQEEMDTLLRTHAIEPAYLRQDDFWGFYEARKQALAQLIQKVMYNPVQGHVSEEERDAIDDYQADYEFEELSA
jgi:hypothetical protein